MFLVECNGSNIFNLSYLGMLLLKAAWRYKRDGGFFFFHPFFLSCTRISFFHPVAKYPTICVTCKVFIKGNVKPCSGNRSFCRSIPKVKPLNQCSVIFPKPLLSRWKRKENRASKTKGQLCGGGTALGSAPGSATALLANLGQVSR